LSALFLLLPYLEESGLLLPNHSGFSAYNSTEAALLYFLRLMKALANDDVVLSKHFHAQCVLYIASTWCRPRRDLPGSWPGTGTQQTTWLYSELLYWLPLTTRIKIEILFLMFKTNI